MKTTTTIIAQNSDTKTTIKVSTQSNTPQGSLTREEHGREHNKGVDAAVDALRGRFFYRQIIIK